MKLPIPKFNEITFEWVGLFLAGLLVGYRLRQTVFAADPAHVLIALDWGILLGAVAYYTGRLIQITN